MDDLLNMKWGTFTPQHFISLVVSLALSVSLHFILRKKSDKTKRLVLFILSFLGPIALLHDMSWGLRTSMLLYLPFHLCSFNAILTPILVWTRNRFLGNLIPLFSVGSALSLIFNTVQAEYSIFSFVFLFHFISHTIGYCIPFLMFSLGLVKPHPKYILPCVGTTFGLYTIAHFVNLFVNEILKAQNILDSTGTLYQVNYMFSLDPQGNPVLVLCWNLIPYQYFYMLAVIPIIALAFGSMNIGFIIRYIKSKRNHENEPLAIEE